MTDVIRIVLASAAVCVALGSAGPLAAQSPASQRETAGAGNYEVELVVFRNLDQSRNTLEVPPPSLTAATPDPGPAAGPVPESGSVYPPLGPQEFRLGAVADQLRRTGTYRLLLHTGWTQPALGQAQALAVPLPPQALEAGLQGTLTLYRERYLHVVVNLELAEPGDAGTVNPQARINQARRIRSRALHYFDHPQFGAIVGVRLVEPAAAASPAATQ